jgi:hypothetical protein
MTRWMFFALIALLVLAAVGNIAFAAPVMAPP